MNAFIRYLLLAILPCTAVLSFGEQPAAESKRSEESEVPGYVMREVDGWPIWISQTLLQDSPDKIDETVTLLRAQIARLREKLPERAYQKICPVPIWLSPKYPGHGPTGEYHPGLGWLKKEGRLPQLHRAIEFTNTDRFAKEVRRMPEVLLHEVAHAYHDQVLGFGNEAVKALYERAKASGKYDSVRRWDGKSVRHYAMSDEKEYFAEMSESFFGKNDFFPFNRQELEATDPRMAELLAKVWDVDQDKE